MFTRLQCHGAASYGFRRSTLRHEASFFGVTMWPYPIPYAVTVADAAAAEASLRFFLYCGAVVLPVIAAYTIGVYWVFRGKVKNTVKIPNPQPPRME